MSEVLISKRRSQETMPIGTLFPRIPLKSHIKGELKNGKTSTPIDLTYTFVDFIPYGQGVMEDDTDLYESPPGVFCLFKKNKADRQPPKSPTAFSYKAQITQPISPLSGKNIIKNIETFYDSNAKLTRLDHSSVAGVPDIEIAPNETGHFRDVHDFNTGIAYNQNLLTGECKIMPIHNSIEDSKESMDEHGFKVIHMLNATEFFHLNGKFQYVGKRKDENGVMMDVWITIKEDWPYPEHDGADVTNYKTMLEWSFLDPSWVDTTDNEQTDDLLRVPYHLYLKIDMQENHIAGSDITWTYDYNIMDFTPSPPHWTAFDISYCHYHLDKKHFVVDFPGSHQDFVRGHIESVKKMMLLSIAYWGEIETHLRVTNIEFEYVADKHIVSAIFTILGRAPVEGDPDHVVEQKRLDWIQGQLESAVKRNQFQVRIPDPKNPDQTLQILTADRRSFREVDRWDTISPHPSAGPTPTLEPKKIPSVPKAFSFKSEIVQPMTWRQTENLIRNSEQW